MTFSRSRAMWPRVLVDTPAINPKELRLKADVLASLLQAMEPNEHGLTQNLSGSVVRDIANLFH